MLNRVRASELVLAAVALAGLCAGLVLTITKILGVTGPVLVGVGIVAAVAATVPGVRGQVSQVLRRQSQQAEQLAAVLAVPIRPVDEVDPFTIGVFPSALADEAQLDRPTLTEGQVAVPPYVPRTVDAGLRTALREASLAESGRLVVLRGDPKSGKSRSLWEAVRTLPGRRLLAVIQPDPAAAPADAAFAPLTTLAGLDRPVSRSRGRDLVIWVDDAHTHLRRGLTRDTLRRLTGLYPAVVIAMTIHAHELDGLRDIDPPLHALLRRPFGDLLLNSELSLSELANARSAYPMLADDPDLSRLAELLAAVNLLTDRYQSHRADQPAGVAVARAAIDWQRAGMPPGSIDEPVLRDLTRLALAGIAPNLDMTDRAFKLGLDWASDEVAAFAALVRREPPGGGQACRFRAFDGVVSWARHHTAPVDSHTWEFVLARARDSDLLNVGIAAGNAQQWETAIRAFHECVFMAAESLLTAKALLLKGGALAERRRYREAIFAYEQVIDRFGAAEDPEIARRVAMALVHKGIVLYTTGRADDAIAAYDQVADWFGTTRDPALAQDVATALVNKGVVLEEKLDRPADALAIYDQVIERFGTAKDPTLAEQVARALNSKGDALGELDRPEEQLATYDQVIERFGDSDYLDLAEQAAKALVSKGNALGQMDRTGEQIAAYEQVILRYDSDSPDLADQVAEARRSKATTLNDLGSPASESDGYWQEVLGRIRAGDLALAKKYADQLHWEGVVLLIAGQEEDALARFDELIEQFSNADDPVLLDFVGMSLRNAASALSGLGRHDQELARYDQTVDLLGDIDDPVLADRVAIALNSKGGTLAELDRNEDAVLAFDQVIDRFSNGHFDEDYEFADALIGKGLALGELGRLEEAIAAFNEVVNRFDENPDLEIQVAKALLNTGLQLGRLGRFDREQAAYDQVIERFGDSEDADLVEQVAKAVAYTNPSEPLPGTTGC